MAMARAWRDILLMKPAEVYKDDRRSRVWRVDIGADAAALIGEKVMAQVGGSMDAGAAGLVVIKRFEYSPLRQRLQWMVGIHPAQRERAMHETLAASNIAVAPIMAWGVEPCGLGVRAWLVQPWLGVSLHHVIRRERGASVARRRAIGDAVADLVAALIKGGWFNRDMKASNVVIDRDGRAWMIDGGAVRLSRIHDPMKSRLGGALLMLLRLDKSAIRAGASRTDRLRCLEALIERLRGVGDVEELKKEILRQDCK